MSADDDERRTLVPLVLGGRQGPRKTVQFERSDLPLSDEELRRYSFCD